MKAALRTATEIGKRALAGQSLAFQWFTASSGSGLVAFAGEPPGQVRVLELDGKSGWRSKSRAFVCAERSIGCEVLHDGTGPPYELGAGEADQAMHEAQESSEQGEGARHVLASYPWLTCASRRARLADRACTREEAVGQRGALVGR